MRVLRLGTKYVDHVTEITCHRCESVLEVKQSEWRKGDYGSEEICNCAVCTAILTKPGTEYRGDF